uniref:Uncharacterized protein n=1 Tax=Alexandrium monilatum TaxID=311494 RepID=A0A7S4SLW2_9DINO
MAWMRPRTRPEKECRTRLGSQAAQGPDRHSGRRMDARTWAWAGRRRPGGWIRSWEQRDSDRRPRLQRRHGDWLAVRVGEAANPGPAGCRRTLRKRRERGEGEERLLGLQRQVLRRLGEVWGPFLRKFLQELVVAMLVQDDGSHSGGGTEVREERADTQGKGGSNEEQRGGVEERRRRRRRPSGEARRRRAADVATPREAAAPRQTPGEEAAERSVGQRPAKPTAAAAAAAPAQDDEGWHAVAAVRRRPRGPPAGWGDAWLRAADWQAEVVPYPSLADWLAKQQQQAQAGVRRVVTCDSEDEEAAAEVLLSAVRAYHAELVRLAPSGASQRVPVQDRSGRVALRPVAVRVVASGSGGGSLFRRQGEVVRLQSVSTAVLRVHFVEDFLEEEAFKRAARNPRQALFAFLQGARVRGVLDAWGWAEERDSAGRRRTVTGLARIAADQAEQLVATSGREGVFVEPLSWAQWPQRETEWVPRVPGEGSSDYLGRAQAGDYDLGLALGRRELGRRRRASDVGPVVRTWRVEGCPRGWTDVMLESLLGQTFQEVHALRRQGRGASACWWFRGRAARGLEVVLLEAEEGGRALRLWAALAPPRAWAEGSRERRPLRGEARDGGAMRIPAVGRCRPSDCLPVESVSVRGAAEDAEAAARVPPTDAIVLTSRSASEAPVGGKRSEGEPSEGPAAKFRAVVTTVYEEFVKMIMAK